MKTKGQLLQVAELGNRALRERAKEVRDINDEKLQKLIDDLIATVNEVDGVGISAPQVYSYVRLFILASHPNPRYPHALKMKPTVVINPKIIELSPVQVKDWEGCLSVPGIRGPVRRPERIKVEYISRTGKKLRKVFTNFIARIFQHEYDHLEGLLFI